MSASLLHRFQGSLVGGVVGDCIGAVYEGCWGATIGIEKTLKLIKKIEAVSESEDEQINKKSKQTWTFTDDTAMARSVAKSLIQHNRLDVKDMARRFTEEYFKESGRGYGGGVVSVFKQLADCDCLDTFGPAKRQFDGQGSYGNGGSMRIGPAGVFAFQKKMDFNQLRDVTEKITLVTHSHPGAIHGAILQCYAVNQALSTEQLDVDTYIDALIAKMKLVEDKREESSDIKKAEPSDTDEKKEDANDSDHDEGDANMNYCDKLEKIREYIKQDKLPSNMEVNKVLGTDISAFRSAPTALYCFLAATKDIPGIESRNPFEKTIIYSISLGGDTDTIATMAGAIAGAYYGLEIIPSSWYTHCEGSEDALKDAESLYNLA